MTALAIAAVTPERALFRAPRLDGLAPAEAVVLADMSLSFVCKIAPSVTQSKAR
jgi:hypothetical protein